MFQDTRPADLDAGGGRDPWSEFRVHHPAERIALLRQLRDGSVPVILNAPDGHALTTTLWTLDDQRQRLAFSADPRHPQLAALVDADEVVAVAYLESVKLQFDLHGLVLVRSLNAASLQTAMPQDLYRFQRRESFRVRPPTSGPRTPTARLRHPSIPEMQLTLRVLDVSAGGCALWLPQDVPPLQAGTQLSEVVIELDDETRFPAALTLQHVTAGTSTEPGVRLGCAWRPLTPAADRALQRWIDQAQRRRRLFSLI
jgi:c-di-GMP-binding flagellar brake protein YcgR